MSNTVEDQVVAMHFDNKQFESGVSQSLGTLDKLKAAMSFSGAGKGIDDINRSVSGFNMNPMQAAIEGISGKFLALSTIAVTAISNITNKVIDAGLKMGKSLVIDPFTQGFAEYSTNLNSIQTIIANTGAELPAVNATLQKLNKYSDLTIYNFGQMAQNIGRFTAAGVKMGPATAAIKGMANTAALSGATAEQLNSAMYQMSQALSTGVIRLMDWNSLANANMGGQNIQKALQATAESGKDAGAAMHEAMAQSGSFRDSLQAGWLTGDIFTKTMKVMSGQFDKTTNSYKAFSIEQLKGMGYSTEAATELNTLSQAAIESATKVKTIGQAYDVIKESIGSGWAKVFQNIFGNFEKSKTLWTNVTQYITGGIASFFGKINKVLNQWNKLGGRFQLLQGIKQAFKDVLRVIIPIKNAFKEVFPPATGQALDSFSRAFHAFFELFRINIKTMHAIREVFVGIFTVIKFVATIVGFAFKMLGKLFGLLGSGVGKGGGFLDTIVETVASFVDWVREGEKLQKMLKGVSKLASAFFKALQPLVPVIQAIGDNIANLVSKGGEIAKGLIDGIIQGINGASIQAALVSFANNIVNWIKEALGIHSPAETMIPIGVNIVLGIAQGIIDSGPRMVEALRTTFKIFQYGLSYLLVGLANAFKDAVTNMDLESFLNIINTLLTGGFLVAATNIAKAFSGVSHSASKVLDEISGSLKVMQSQVKADIIKSLAVAILLLAGAAYILSTLDGKKLAYSMGAIAGLMTSLVISMKILMGGNMGKDQSLKDISKKAASLVTLGIGMDLFAAAILILAQAVKVLGKMDPDTLKQGLEAVAKVVLGVVAATAILGKTGGGGTILAAALALLVLSAALVAFAGTMAFYAKLDWGMIVDGGGKAAAVIFGIGLAMQAFGKFAITGAIGLAIASVGLLLLAKALEKVSKIKEDSLGNALVALVVAIGAVALAGKVLSGGGAAGLLAGAAAILVIAFAFKILSKIPADALVRSFTFIGLAFVALALAAQALTPAIPVMAAFGTAALLVGAGIALAGLGVLLFATALGIIAVVGPAAFQALSDGANLLADTLSNTLVIFAAAAAVFIVFGAGAVIAGAGLTILALAIVVFSAALVVFAAAVVVMSVSLLLLAGAIATLRHSAAPSIHDLVEAFKKLLDIKNVLSDLKDAVGEWIGKQIDKLKNAITPLKAAISGLIQAMKDKITGWKDDMLNWGKDIGGNLIDGIVDGLENAWHWVEEKINWISDHIPGWMKKRMGIESPSKVMRDQIGQWIAKGVAQGISDHTSSAETASKDLADKSLDAMRFAFNNSRKMGDSLRDIRPTITPVLDLTQLAKDASQIGGHLGKHTINTGLSGRQAADISGGEGRRRMDAVASVNETYTFNQTINSPKAVNKVDVYRGTKSQFALFREVKGS